MRAGGRDGAPWALSRVSLMTEPHLWCEGPSPRTARGPVPREESRRGAGPPVSWLTLLAPVCGCSDQPGKWRAGSLRGWHSGELVPEMTADRDPAAAELKGSFFLFSSSLADGGMDVFL